MTDNQWWRADFEKNYCPAFSDMIPVIEHIVAEQNHHTLESVKEMVEGMKVSLNKNNPTELTIAIAHDAALDEVLAKLNKL